MSLLLWLAGAVASAFIGLLLTILFQDQISSAVISALQGFQTGDGHRTLSGDWYSYYVIFPEKGTSSTARTARDTLRIIRLRQVGTRVAGRGIGKGRNYFTLAIFQEPYLTGTWRNSINGRRSWGAFQLFSHDSSDWMVGKFVGKDSKAHVNHGIWLWARESNELYAAADWAGEEGYVPDIAELKERLGIVLGRDNSGEPDRSDGSDPDQSEA